MLLRCLLYSAWLIFAATLFTLAPALHAQAQPPQHALSPFGAPKYKDGFAHFDYVNPNAPKGGAVRLAAFGSFDSFNPYIIKGKVASGLGLIYDTLTTPSLDEPDTQYGLVAERMWHAPDYSTATFTLRPEARFHDGTPMTAEDVIWTFEALKKHHPFYRTYYADVAAAQKSGARQVTFTFSSTGNRELPQIVGALPVLPKHYWTRPENDISKTTLTPPLGSGPYRIDGFEAGRNIRYARVADYWARDLNVNRGAYNFDTIRYDYFSDLTIALEAFKAGDVDFWSEVNSKRWATDYDIAAVRDGRIKIETPPNGNIQGMQSFVLNQRRALFQDPLVREALVYAYNFEWANKTLFYGQYTRTDSFFDNSELGATQFGGLPSEAELKLLTPWRGQIPERVFTTPYTNPTNPDPSNMRVNLRHAKKLFAQAGWHVKDNKLQKDGQVFDVEFLLVQAGFERIVAPYIKNLQKLGIQANIRSVDAVQYKNRLIDYDFDIVVGSFAQSLSPGNEQRNYWSSASAEQAGGRNIIGIQSPAIDALVEHIIFAKTRPAQIAATRALDRVLLWNFYAVPHWHLTYHRLAYWHSLAHPPILPLYSHGFPNIWWLGGKTGANH